MKTANLVIIGGGVIGTAIASSLARDIKNIVLIEKEGIAAQASGSNYGIVDHPRTLGFEYEMMSRTLKLYDDLVDNHFDVDIELEKVGGLKVGFSPAQKKALEWYCRTEQEMGIPLTMLNAREVKELEPNLNPEITSAIFCAADTQINPYMTVMGFANLAKRRGAEILSGTEVYNINIQDGKVVSVETSAGTIQTEAVIISAGYKSRAIAKTAGIDLPIFPQRLQSLVTEPKEKLLTRIIQGMWDLSDEDAETNPRVALEYDFEITGTTEDDLPKAEVEDTIFAFLKPTISNTIVLGTTSEFVGEDRRTTPRGLSAIIRETLKICPALSSAQIIRTWSALIPYTFDSKPILGKVPEIPGLYIAAGHPHAMSHAPTVGEIFSELFTNENNLSEFAKFILNETRITRFSSYHI